MRMFIAPPWLMILSFFLVWPAIHIGISKFINKTPDSEFDMNSAIFKTHKWENNGKIYERVFKIRSWKHLLPDGAAVFNEGFEKKHLKDVNEVYIRAFIKETCRAELAHWLQIVPFWIFGLWSPAFVVWIMLVYALMMNLPCIIAQRYNRPRLANLLEMLEDKKQ